MQTKSRRFLGILALAALSLVDLKTLQTLSKVDTGENPDGMLFVPGQ